MENRERNRAGTMSSGIAGAAGEWLSRGSLDCLSVEVVLNDPHTPYRLLVRRKDGRTQGAITCVSLLTVRGMWFLECRPPSEGVALVEAFQGRPVKLTTSGKVKAAIRTALLKRWKLPREHDLLAMVCRRSLGSGSGRWATESDRHALEAYQAAYNKERDTAINPDWHDLVDRKQVAVLDVDGHPAAFLKRTGMTTKCVCIGGTYTLPEYRRQGLARRLTAFVVGESLRERPAVHLIVDDDNAPAIALYDSLGFRTAGRCYMAYFGEEKQAVLPAPPPRRGARRSGR